MGKKSSDAPDYTGAAEATADADKEMLEAQTKANRPNQNNPWGNIKWTQDSAGNWTQDTTLNDDLQGALDSQLGLQKGRTDLAGGMLGRMEGEFGDPLDWSKYGAPTELEFNADQIRQKAEDAAYDRASGRLDSQYADSDNALEVSLRNRGLSEGDAAFDNAMKNQNESRTDAYAAAQDESVRQGRAEADQMYQQQVGDADYANKIRQQQMTEEMTRRGFTLNEINAIMSGQQVQAPQFENYISAGKATAPDYLGAANAESNFNQAQDQSMWSGIGTGLGMLGMFCDRRLKTNIERVGTFKGFPFYTFDYVWGEEAAGVMADEVNKDAVYTHPSGYSVVDYGKLNAGGA